MSSSVSPDSFMSAKALRILKIRGEKMRANHSRDWIRWDHDICWEAVFRGNIPKPLFLSSFVYLVFGRLILSDPVACKGWIPECNTEWGEAGCGSCWEFWWNPRLSRGIEALLLCCSSVWSALVSEMCSCSKQGLHFLQGCAGAAQGCVSVMGVLLWELMQF